MFAGGKRRGRAAVAAVSAGSLTLHDATSNRSFLVDTGAEVSVVPASEEERQRAPTQKQLVAANGTRIRCFRRKEIATAGRGPELRVEVLGGRGQETAHRGGFPDAYVVARRPEEPAIDSSGGIKRSASTPIEAPVAHYWARVRGYCESVAADTSVFRVSRPSRC